MPLTSRPGCLRRSVILEVWGWQIPVIPLSRVILNVLFIMVCTGGSGDRHSHQQLRRSSDRGNCSTFGLHLSLFSLHLFPLQTIFPSFGDWLMWHARFSLGHTLRHKSLLDTLETSIVRLQLSWNTKRITASGWNPEREHDLSVHSCLSPHLSLCLSGLFPSVRSKWHKNGEKDLTVRRNWELIYDTDIKKKKKKRALIRSASLAETD